MASMGADALETEIARLQAEISMGAYATQVGTSRDPTKMLSMDSQTDFVVESYGVESADDDHTIEQSYDEYTIEKSIDKLQQSFDELTVDTNEFDQAMAQTGQFSKSLLKHPPDSSNHQGDLTLSLQRNEKKIAMDQISPKTLSPKQISASSPKPSSPSTKGNYGSPKLLSPKTPTTVFRSAKNSPKLSAPVNTPKTPSKQTTNRLTPPATILLTPKTPQVSNGATADKKTIEMTTPVVRSPASSVPRTPESHAMKSPVAPISAEVSPRATNDSPLAVADASMPLNEPTPQTILVKKKRKKKVIKRKIRKKKDIAIEPATSVQDPVHSEVSVSQAAPQAPRRSAAFLAEIQRHELLVSEVSESSALKLISPQHEKNVPSMPNRPPAFLAQIQQHKREENVVEAASVVMEDEVSRLQAEIEKMQAEIAAGATTRSSAKKASHNRQVRKKKSEPVGSEAQRLQAEIEKMQAEIDTEQTGVSGVPAPPVRPPMFNLLGAIAEAATSRDKRVEQGDTIMREVQPEVEAKTSTPQLSTSMAEMVSQMAAARDKRLADGGEKRMRAVVIKEKDEYKKDFSSIVEDAAAMGRLTRFDEHAVEAVAQEKTPEQEWKSQGLLAIQWRSNHMAVIHEAAKAGNAAKLPEHIVSNCPELEQEWDPESGGNPMSPRMQQLLELDAQVGEGQRKVDKLVLGRKEEQPKGDSLLIRPMYAYRNGEVQLPRKAPPKIDPSRNAEKLSKMKLEAIRGGRPMVDISVGVAEIAWERRARLDRPGSLPRVREMCSCPYCGDASPYQTFAYRELARKHKEEMRERQQANPIAHEAQNDLLDSSKAMVPDGTVADEQPMENQISEIERKRLERKRIREERRKLQAVREAEIAAENARKASQVAETHQHTSTVSNVHTPSEQYVGPAIAGSQLSDHVKMWNTESPKPDPSASHCKCLLM